MSIIEILYVLAIADSLTIVFNLGVACVAIAIPGRCNGVASTARRADPLDSFGADVILWIVFSTWLIQRQTRPNEARRGGTLSGLITGSVCIAPV